MEEQLLGRRLGIERGIYQQRNGWDGMGWIDEKR